MLAHSANDNGQTHDLLDHLTSVGSRGHAILTPLASHLAPTVEVAGILHDIGKACSAFQQYLAGQSEWVPHELYSAWAVLQTVPPSPARDLLLFLILAHHRGFNAGFRQDLDTTKWTVEDLAKTKQSTDTQYGGHHDVERDRIRIPQMQEILNWCKTPAVVKAFDAVASLPAPSKGWTGLVEIRTLLGALTRADVEDTAHHYGEQPGKTPNPLPDLISLLDAHSARLSLRQSPMRSIRQDLYRQASTYTGDHRVVVIAGATGTGKTMAGLRCAAQMGAQQIIWTIPFLSIVDQTMRLLEGSLGVKAREHTSVPISQWLDEQAGRPRSAYSKRDRSEIQDWNHSLILTTTQRLSMVLTGRNKADARRMLALYRPNTVVVLDEAAALPGHKLHGYLNVLLNIPTVRIVLMSAAHESLRDTVMRVGVPAVYLGSNMPVPNRRYFRFEQGEDPGINLNTPQALVICNTRHHARNLWVLHQDRARMSPHRPVVFLLTGDQCPADRLLKIAEIQQHLADGVPIWVIATQVVETGVDLDFPVLHRTMAPLDAILQSAGRCNRNGLWDCGDVVIWWTPTPNGAKYPGGEEGDYYLAAMRAQKLLRPKWNKGLNDAGLDQVLHRMQQDVEAQEQFKEQVGNSRHYVNARMYGKLAKYLQAVPETDQIPVLVPFGEAREKFFAEMDTGNVSLPLDRLPLYQVNVWAKPAIEMSIRVVRVLFGKNPKPRDVAVWTGKYSDVGIETLDL